MTTVTLSRPSFEAANFRRALEGMGHELVAFDFMAEIRAHGKREMNRRLLAAAEEATRIFSFFFLFEDQIDPETIRGVSRAGGPTVNWFADDHWRFDRFSRHFAPALDWSVTTDRDSLPKYAAIGYENVILSQWACNRYAYDRTAKDLEYDVTFIGQAYGERPATVERLRAEGFDVRCWGFGWPEGRIEHDEMVRVFGASRINLNLSSAFSQPERLLLRLLRPFRGPREKLMQSDQGPHLRGARQRRLSASRHVTYLEDIPRARRGDRHLRGHRRPGGPGRLVARA